LHLLLAVPRREWPLRSLIQAGLVWAVLIAPWFGYMFLNFGIKRTLGANTTVGRYYVAEDEHGVPIPHYRVMAANLCTDFFTKSLCRPLLPPAGPSDCISVQGDVRGIVESPVPCSAGLVESGMSALLGVSGQFAWGIALLTLTLTNVLDNKNVRSPLRF